MTTGAILVQDAMYQAQILGQDQTVQSGDSQLVLRMLNRMLDSWANVKDLVYVVTTESFVMTPGTGTYATSVLSGGRPVSIDSIFVRLSNVDYPVELIDIQSYNAIVYKPVSAVPAKCYYDQNWPEANFNFYPLPYAAFTCFVSHRDKLHGTIESGTDVTMPPGYEKAIVDTLAVYICGPFGKTPTADMKQQANEAKFVLKATNYDPLIMSTGFDRSYSVNNDFPYSGF